MTLSTVTATATQALQQAAEEAEHAAAISPWAVGGIALAILLAMLLALVAFGGGREHS